MKKTFIAAALFGASGIALADSKVCDFSVNYDINVNDASVLFDKSNGDSIEFKGEKLFINGESVELTDEQRRASLELQRGAREMVPKIAEIAVEGAELGIKATTIVLSTLFGNDTDIQNELLKPIEAISDKIQEHISDTRMNTAELEKAFDNAFDEEFEQMIETAASKYSGRIVGNVLSAVFSGDQEELKDLEFRMESLETDIEKYVTENASEIERKAEELCLDMAVLDKFDSELESVSGYPKGGILTEDGDGLRLKNFSWNK
ncbi:MAG: YggN family protein [Kangiellaceae bacterium]|nr:YggN family protein [Kangiellaceae bacterium]MCW9000890.1 YggN family protein [Kangiellaceae bacterium]